jgi:hypothetical protein
LELPNDKRKEGTAAMKETAKQYVALDVHQATLVVSVRDEKVEQGGVYTFALRLCPIILSTSFGLRVTYSLGHDSPARYLRSMN